jgi:hypothetical protein
MKTNTLSRLLCAKYPFLSEGVGEDVPPKAPRSPAPERVLPGITPKFMSEVEQTISKGYKDWVLGNYNAFISFANVKEPVSKSLMEKFETLISNLKRSSQEEFVTDPEQKNVLNQYAADVYEEINKIMKFLLVRIQGDDNFDDNVLSFVKRTRHPEVNWAENRKGQYYTTVVNMSSILHKLGSSLQMRLINEKIVPFPLIDGTIKQKRKALSRDVLTNFMFIPAAAKFNIDNPEVLGRLKFYPEIFSKVTTLINAIKRGKKPKDGPEVAKEAQEIIDALKAKNTNEFAFDSDVDIKNPQAEHARIREVNKRVFEKNKPDTTVGPDPLYDTEFVAQRNKEEAEKARMHANNLKFQQEEAAKIAKEKKDLDDIEKDKTRFSQASYNSKLINKYSSLSFSDWLKRSSR